MLENHGELFRLSRFGHLIKAFSDFERLLKDNSYKVKSFKKGVLTNPDLKDYSILIVGLPHKDILQEEIRLLREFVYAGGGLLLLARANNVLLYDTKVLQRYIVNLDSLNQLTSNFGIVFEKDLIEAGKNLKKAQLLECPIITQFSPHPIVQGVKELIIGEGVPIRIEGDARAIAVSDADTTPPNCIVLATTQFGQGRVVAIGTHSIFTRLSILKIPLRLGLYEPNHLLLVMNVINWLAGRI